MITDDWEKPRSRATHLTDAEKQIIRDGYRADRPAKEVARDLKCSSRVVNGYYALYRAEGRPRITKRDRARGTPPRFYKSNFEPL